jgi:predicted nucleic acid-binding Zn ribbon protein
MVSRANQKGITMARGRGTQRIGDVLAQLIARRGYARLNGSAVEAETWQEAVGPPFDEHSRPGHTRRGVLEVTVRNSTILQELVFRKAELIEKLIAQLPDTKISDLRFRVGVID